MAISDDDVLHVARLARLTLRPDEVGRLREQLASSLGHVQALQALDLDGVQPTAHALDVANAVRPDAARASWPRDEVLAGAPDPAEGGFRVPPTA
jgi:aspartyl-tRNA(Asn)/glutamyl-tRNA(Gln) amidotransferase subunit C